MKFNNMRIAAGNHEAQRHAAEELQKYIAKITGITLAITEPDGNSGNTILIGDAAPMTQEDRDALIYDGFIIRTLPQNGLMLTGSKPISSLFAVYSFLENYCGCGFCEDGERIPYNPDLTIGEIDVLDNPRFEYRFYGISCNMNYGGMMWDKAEELIAWIDAHAKQRINVIWMDAILRLTALCAQTLQEMGYDIRPTACELERSEAAEAALNYAIRIGMQLTYMTSIGAASEAMMFCYDGKHYADFMRQYNETHDEPIGGYEFRWAGRKSFKFDLRHPEVERLYLTSLKVYNRKYPGSHLYFVSMPSEGSFSSKYSPDEVGNMLIECYSKQVKLIRDNDKDAVVFSSSPFPYCKTYRYQMEAVKGHDTILFEYSIDQPGGCPYHMLNNYFGGDRRWVTGTLSHCANETNPAANIRFALERVKSFAADPRTRLCVGFGIHNEKRYRNVLANDLYHILAWNPAELTIDEYLEKYTLRRYGTLKMLPAVKGVADTLYAGRNTGMENCVLYRNFHDQYRTGMIADSVRLSIRYIPTLYQALQCMADCAEELEGNGMFRMDAVDYGRTYLGFFFNLYLGGARLGGHDGDIRMVREYSRRTLQVMEDIAKLCSAHKEFRLQSYYDNASRFSPCLPENADSNRRCIFTTFTNLHDYLAENENVTDYMAEDWTELITYYYRPQVEAYLEDLEKLVVSGGKLSGRLVTEGGAELPNRLNDFAPPKGRVKWSAFGPTCEPELISRQADIRKALFLGPCIQDASLRYDGPIAALLEEMLEKYRPAEEIGKLLDSDPLLTDTDDDDVYDEDMILSIAVGEEWPGVSKGITAEQCEIDKNVRSLFDLTVIAKEYNISRGDIVRIRVRATDFVRFTRIEDAPTADGSGAVKRFSFTSLDKKYIMEIDEGSEFRAAAVNVYEID